MSNKQDLPIESSTNNNYSSEANYFKILTDMKPRSSSGVATFTSTTSGITYSTETYNGGIYSNEGQEGLLLVLQDALAPYLLTATDFNNKTETSDFTSHTSDTNLHVTSTKQTTWNNKVDQSLLTTQGDIPYATSASTWVRLAKGTAYQSLNMNSGATAPQYMASLQSLITASGDMIYGSSANTPVKLAKGTDGQLLTLVSGLPAWQTLVKSAQGNYTDTSTYITANGTFPVTIPMGINAQRGRLIISKIGGSLGAIIFFGTNITDAFSLVVPSLGIYYGGNQLTPFSGGSFSFTSNNDANIQSVVISGSNLIITFVVTNYYPNSSHYYYTLRWEVEG